MNATLRELNNNSSALARRAEAGETITITDRGRPIADLVPHRPRFRFARKPDVLAALRGAGGDSHERFRQQLDELIDPYFVDPYAAGDTSGDRAVS